MGCGSGRRQHEIDVDRIVGEFDHPVFRAIDDACIQQRVNVGMNGLDVTIDTARDLADRQRPCARRSAEDRPTLLCQDFP